MTHDEAQVVFEKAQHMADSMLQALVKATTPDVAITALGMVSGAVFASLGTEDNIDTDEMFDSWLDGVKSQYKETMQQIEAAKKMQQ